MSAQQEAKDAATPLGAAWIAHYRPGMGSREVEAFKAAWRARGEADRAAVEQVSGPVMIGGEAITALGDALAAIAALGEEQ